ncbi:calcium-binding protein [Solirubrobacter soli]|uniref:calcium-binding protein n=1 Tax=Solirubrobacter soli TaxID=363832 RepID=UPI00146AD966|nr:calcium-binding protein [Solirubrobacter soli]
MTPFAIAAGVAAFALPGTASAAVTSTFANNTLTVTSDDAGDNITIGVAGANITAPGTAGIPNDGTVSLVVNAGGGNDNINISAPNFAGSPVVNGGDGDDTIVGSARTDTIDGGNGNDRITAGKNTVATDPETIHGGAGNDVIIWNNGDGDDINEGDAGVDETQILEAGTADDGNTITQEGTTTRFERTSGAGGFKVFSTNTMEKLSLQSFSGNDTVATGPGVPIAMSIDSGPGNDTISTGDGPDRIVGDRGDDTINAGGGEDTMVWTNGDGNDIMNGDAGTDIVENDLGNADDVSTLKMENGRVRYDRVNAPFSLSIGTSEVMLLNTFGGNDTLTTAPDVGIWLDVNAGAGNDIIQGAAGSDRIDGGDGNDAINVRDAQADLVTGGPGTDSATVDAGDAVGADVENVDRAAAPQPLPAPAAGALTLPKTAKVSKGVAQIKVSCPAGTAGCAGSIALFSAKTIKVGALRAKLELGRASFNVAAGQSKTVKIKLAPGTAKLAKKKKLAVTARVGEKTSKLTLSF